jgi:hypothetical protein
MQHERGAFLLFRKIRRDVKGQSASTRFLLVDIVEMDGDWVLGSSKSSLRINMRKLPEVYFRCEQDDLELGFAHSHPSGHEYFSPQDDKNEQSILRGFSRSNGRDVYLISMVLSGGTWIGRTRHAAQPDVALDARHIAVLDRSISLYNIKDQSTPSDLLKRQEAAFGKPFSAKMKSLRVVVVGAGGTGSPMATLLARAGVGELIIIDGDVLEESNLNRVRGYRRRDAGKNKAITLARYIRTLDLGTTVSAIDEYLHESPKAVDAIATADVVFGCTDDVAGRDILNQSLYYYALGYIDVGLTGRIDTGSDSEPYLRDHRGRVSCILPEYGACLRCQRVVTEMKLRYEAAIKRNPELANLDPETLQRDYYLVGGGEAAPGVGPFTSATADAGVATLMNLIKPYRQIPSDLRQDNVWHDFVHMSVHSNEPNDDPDCIYCRGRELLLKRERGYRLDMPALGKLN